MAEQTKPLKIDLIQHRIFLIRGEKVIFDRDLAEIYGVSTKVLNQAVNRNSKRFPQDFMFRLTKAEKREVVTNCDRLERIKYSPVAPAVFTEHGAILAAGLLNSPKAIEISVFVVRAFVQLRLAFEGQLRLAKKVQKLEEKTGSQDRQIMAIIESIKSSSHPLKKVINTELVLRPGEIKTAGKLMIKCLKRSRLGEPFGFSLG